MTFALRFVLALTLARLCFGQTGTLTKNVTGTAGPGTVTLTGVLPKSTLSPETRARLWRAVAEVNAVKGSYDAAQSALVAARTAAEAECGQGFALKLDAAGEPSCGERPPEPKPAAELKRPEPRK